MSAQVFFGVGAGRCGTMSLANWLSSEPGVQCLHEGKERRLTEPGEQWLPFLTLQNYAAYKAPETAVDLLRQTRGGMPELAAERGLAHLGDVAYNYAPFVHALPTLFPAARLVVLVRDGRDFVRSVVTDETPDPTPVGWLDDDREMDRVERFIALGRLRPVPGSDEARTWPEWSLVEKNAWLWAETYRVILDGMSQWPEDQVKLVRFEDLMADIPGVYAEIRAFLGIDGPIGPDTERLLTTRINERRRRVLPPPSEWSDEIRADFDRRADAMMRRLGYRSDRG